MADSQKEEEFTEEHCTYTLQVGDRFYVVEKVPARVSQRTGERLFSPETVERLQRLIWGQAKPVRVLETPVFEFVA